MLLEKYIKFYLFIILFITRAWGGWYASEEKIKEGLEKASVHPLTHCNGAVLEYGTMKGSAAVVHREWIVTAAHVLEGSFKGEGPQVLAGSYAFSHDGIKGEESWQVTNNYVFPKQDLAFLKLEAPLPPEWVAPVLPFDLHQSLLTKCTRKPPAPGEGNPAFFFGCGHKINLEKVPSEKRDYVHALQRPDIPSDRLKLSQNFGEKALGECHLSQYFASDSSAGSCFFSWIDMKKRKGNSALPGDSGGALFVEEEEHSYLTGVVSNTYADAEWDTKGRTYLGTSFATLYSPEHEAGKESYLETVLRQAAD